MLFCLYSWRNDYYHMWHLLFQKSFQFDHYKHRNREHGRNAYSTIFTFGQIKKKKLIPITLIKSPLHSHTMEVIGRVKNHGDFPPTCYDDLLESAKYGRRALLRIHVFIGMSLKAKEHAAALRVFPRESALGKQFKRHN